MSKFCRFCGTELNEENKFCTNCGKSTGAEIVYIKTDNEKKNSIQIALMILICLSVIAMFLPYYSILGFSVNFYETFDADAVFLIVCQVFAIILLLFSNKVSKVLLVITQIISCGVVIFDYLYNDVRINDAISKYSNISLNVYGIGCYILLIATIISAVISLVRCNEKYR